MKKIFTIIALSLISMVSAQNKLPYKIFTADGIETSYSEMLKEIEKTDVLLFGEYHDNSLVHWLQLKTVQDASKVRKLVLGAEMIEADDQLQLNRYLSGEIDQKAFDTLARIWPNHKTDYKPLVDFAKDNKLNFIATNVPRRYASLVYKGGFEKLEVLSDEEKLWIAPLPIAYDKNLPGYKKMFDEMGDHGGENLPKAQALKDVTMAHFIIKNSSQNSLFIHFNGTYHSDFYDGIYWYLKSERPKMKILTIATVTAPELKLAIEDRKKADFIIVVDQDMTKTY